RKERSLLQNERHPLGAGCLASQTAGHRKPSGTFSGQGVASDRNCDEPGKESGHFLSPGGNEFGSAAGHCPPYHRSGCGKASESSDDRGKENYGQGNHRVLGGRGSPDPRLERDVPANRAKVFRPKEMVPWQGECAGVGGRNSSSLAVGY